VYSCAPKYLKQEEQQGSLGISKRHTKMLSFEKGRAKEYKCCSFEKGTEKTESAIPLENGTSKTEHAVPLEKEQ